MMNIKKITSTVKNRRESSIKVLISSMAYLSLWGCSKVDLNMGNQVHNIKRHFEPKIQEEYRLMDTSSHSQSISTSQSLAQDENQIRSRLECDLKIAQRIAEIEREINQKLARSSSPYARRIYNRYHLDNAMKWIRSGSRAVAGISSICLWPVLYCWLENSSSSYQPQQPNMSALEGYSNFFMAQRSEYIMEGPDRADPKKLLLQAISMDRTCKTLLNNSHTALYRKGNEQGSYDPMAAAFVIGLSMVTISSAMELALDWVDKKYFRMDEVNADMANLKDMIDNVVRDYEYNIKLKDEIDEMLERNIKTLRGGLGKSLDTLSQILNRIQNMPENCLYSTSRCDFEKMEYELEKLKKSFQEDDRVYIYMS